MTDKQKRFCEEYLIDCNATQAAIRTGYSEKTAYSQGQRLLKNVEIQSYIAKMMDQKSKSAIASQDEILEFLTDVVRGSVKETVVTNKGDPIEVPTDTTDRIRAAELIGKRYGSWTEKIEANADMNLNITVHRK